MTDKTTEAAYDDDFLKAQKLVLTFVNQEKCDGNAKKWIDDALNDSWREGLTIEQWVAEAISSIPASFRGLG